jgi:hypothetical protein
MKRIILIICLCFLSLGAFSQKKNAWSLEVGASTYAYNINEIYDNYNRFNYEFFIFTSKNFSLIKLTTGIMYSTKNIRMNSTYIENDNNYFYKADYDIDYIKLPILASVGYSFKRVKLSIIGGFIFDHILNCREKAYYRFSDSEYKDYKPNGINIAVRGGITLSTEIFNNINLSLQPFVDYKLVADKIYPNDRSILLYYNSDFPNSTYSGGLLSYGLSIGFEYVF